MSLHQLYCFKRDLLLKESVDQSVIGFKDLPPIVLRTSLKRGLPNKESLLPAAFFLELISGQKALGCRAKKSFASYKIRQGDLIGWQVTLRGSKRDSFLDKWICHILPEEEDFFKISNLSSFF